MKVFVFAVIYPDGREDIITVRDYKLLEEKNIEPKDTNGNNIQEQLFPEDPFAK